MGMQIVLQQVFPFGRFHATPWRANPFDDPYGEWPPSPWRLVRAVVARWYQWAREATTEADAGELDALVAALCRSRYRFHLPPNTRRGGPLRQYHPVEFGMDPPNFKAWSAEFAMPDGGVSDDLRSELAHAGAETVEAGAGLLVHVGKSKAKKKLEQLLGKPLTDWSGLRPDPGMRGYSTSLTQDNYWCVAPTEAVWWFVDGKDWTNTLVGTLDHCLQRITYFGRAETFTRIQRAPHGYPEPNCELSEHRGTGLVPVLVPSPCASRDDVERVTDDEKSVTRSIPPGTRVMYALRPPRPPVREMPFTRFLRPDCRLVQLALGWQVVPEARAVVRLTARFRDLVLRELLRVKTGDRTATWDRVDASVREAMADMVGKDAQRPLTGHRHAEFLVWIENGVVARLLVWRDGRPFDEDEQTAILRAASRELSWAAAGPDTDAWKVRLVPLDRAVPPPPGFDEASAPSWESATPYVPPRHHLRGGKPRERESLVAQIRRELALRGFDEAERVEVEQIGGGAWVAVHVPRRQAGERSFLGDRRGYLMRLTFPKPVRGPLRLGHSSSFGLGLFRPAGGT
jgi:CRISPR-associated protein Csb2